MDLNTTLCVLGYRPILDAMKSFSPSSNPKDCCADIEVAHYWGWRH